MRTIVYNNGNPNDFKGTIMAVIVW